jgi:hypothetical protein
VTVLRIKRRRPNLVVRRNGSAQSGFDREWLIRRNVLFYNKLQMTTEYSTRCNSWCDMRNDGDRLDSAESYTSPKFANEKGRSPRDVSSRGGIPVGRQGRAGKKVYDLGLIVEK